VKVVKVNTAENTQGIPEAAKVLQAGGTVIFPTDTVYGIGASVECVPALEKIYSLKNRPQDKPVAVLVSSVSQAKCYAEIPPATELLMKKFWPGALTFILRASAKLPQIISGKGRVGLRMPDSPVARALIDALGKPIATTSVNLSGRPEITEVSDLPAEFSKVNLVLDAGPVKKGVSSVLDTTVSPPGLLREGITAYRVQAYLKHPEKSLSVLFVCTANVCRSVMAEGVFRHMLNTRNIRDVKVSSAGVNALRGSAPSLEAMKVLRERGIEVPERRSQPVTGNLIEETDLIFVMTTQHREAVSEIASENDREKIKLLGESDIIDPIGGTTEAYRFCLEEIQEGLDEVIEKI